MERSPNFEVELKEATVKTPKQSWQTASCRNGSGLAQGRTDYICNPALWEFRRAPHLGELAQGIGFQV
jgi:hypothetical protein